MEDIEQRLVTMTLYEFKSYRIPDGWKLAYFSGSMQYAQNSEGIFMVRVTLQKEG